MRIATLTSFIIFLGIQVSNVLVTQVALASSRCNEINAVRLTANSPSINFSGVLTAPGSGYQKYKITCIDVTSFPQGGRLVIEISLSNGVSGGSFDLFPHNVPIPTQGRPDDSLVGQYDISPNSSTRMFHYFESGTIFQFGATGNWYSPKGSTNFYKVNAHVERFSD